MGGNVLSQDGGTPRVAPPTPEQRRGMKAAIAGQCFGCLGQQAFQNGLMLLYLKGLAFSDVAIVVCLAFPYLLLSLLSPVTAYWSDRLGRKRLVIVGAVLQAVGFLACTLLGALPGAAGQAGVVAGLAAWGLSSAITNGAWFSLLSGVAPPGVRGRFFGKLRFSWQLAGVAFAALAAPFLAQDTPVVALQCLLGVVTLAMFVRPAIFTAIPDLGPREPLAEGFLRSLAGLARIESYASFVAYAFLLALFTAGCPALFGLVEKRFLGLGDNTVLWLGNVFMIGSMVGYFAGGKVADRWGTKPVFLVCHFTFAAALIAYVFRGSFPLPVVAALGAIRFVFGMVMAASSVAISTEMLAICPARGLSLSTSVCNTMYVAGSSLSGLMSGWALKLGFLQKQWTLMGAPLSEYDAILLVYGVMVGLLVVTLGLAPSVIGKADWDPR